MTRKRSPAATGPSSSAEVTTLVADLARVRPDLDTWPYRIFASAAVLTRRLTSALEPTFEQAGIKGGDYEILSQLRRAERPADTSPTELSRALHLTTGAMTRRLDRLEADGYVRRVPHGSDRRSIFVELTPEGLAVADRTLECVLALMSTIVGPVRDRTAEFEDIVRAILDGLTE